jgi:hypothetical protein
MFAFFPSKSASGNISGTVKIYFCSGDLAICFFFYLRNNFMEGSGTPCAKYSSVGSNIASGMAAAITTGHPTSNWRDETQGCNGNKIIKTHTKHVYS